MHEQYQHDQERLLNVAEKSVGAAVTVTQAAIQLWMSRHKPIKVQVDTAASDVREATSNLKQGKSQPELFQAITQGKTYQRIKRAGGDADKYARLMMRKAEIDRAVKLNPAKTITKVKTPKKSL